MCVVEFSLNIRLVVYLDKAEYMDSALRLTSSACGFESYWY